MMFGDIRVWDEKNMSWRRERETGEKQVNGNCFAGR